MINVLTTLRHQKHIIGITVAKRIRFSDTVSSKENCAETQKELMEENGQNTFNSLLRYTVMEKHGQGI